MFYPVNLIDQIRGRAYVVIPNAISMKGEELSNPLCISWDWLSLSSPFLIIDKCSRNWVALKFMNGSYIFKTRYSLCELGHFRSEPLIPIQLCTGKSYTAVYLSRT